MDFMTVTLLLTIIIFFVFSLWFINKYLAILYKKEDIPETDFKESNVIPNLIDSVNKNDKKIIDEVNKTNEHIEDIENTLQNKMNQIETNKHNVSKLFGNIDKIRDKLQTDYLHASTQVANTLKSENDEIIGTSIDDLNTAWQQTNEIAMSNINDNINKKKVDIERDIFNSLSSNVESSFVSSSNFNGFSNAIGGSIDQMNSNIADNSSSITALSTTMSSNYLPISEFASFSNNAITKTNLESNLPNRLSDDVLENKYFQIDNMTSKISDYLTSNNLPTTSNVLQDTMSNYLTENEYLKNDSLTGYASVGSVASLSNSLSNNIDEGNINSAMSNYLNDNNYINNTSSFLEANALSNNIDQTNINTTMSNYLNDNNYINNTSSFLEADALSNNIDQTNINTTMSNYLDSNNYINSSNINDYVDTSGFVGADALSNNIDQTNINTNMSTYLETNNYINSSNIDVYTSNYVSQTDFESLSNSLSNYMRTDAHTNYISGHISQDGSASDDTASNTTRINALETNVEALSNDMINNVSFDSASNLLTLEKNSGGDINVNLSSLATASSASPDPTAVGSFNPGNLSLSLDDTNGLCVKYGDSFSNCIAFSNVQELIYTKDEYSPPLST